MYTYLELAGLNEHEFTALLQACKWSSWSEGTPFKDMFLSGILQGLIALYLECACTIITYHWNIFMSILDLVILFSNEN